MVTVTLPAPHEMFPSGPMWTFLDDHVDGLAIVSKPNDGKVVLTARKLAGEGTQTVLRFTPAAAREVAAALLAAADHAEPHERTR